MLLGFSLSVSLDNYYPNFSDVCLFILLGRIGLVSVFCKSGVSGSFYYCFNLVRAIKFCAEFFRGAIFFLLNRRLSGGKLLSFVVEELGVPYSCYSGVFSLRSSVYVGFK